MGNGEDFLIKARQVECAHNLDQQGSEMQLKLPEQPKRQPESSRPKSPKANFYEQQQLLDHSHPHHEEQQKDPRLGPHEEYNHYCDLIATESEYKIISPHSTGPHRCRYTIRRTSMEVCAVDIKFQMFRLEEEPPGSMVRCRSEFMEIDAGKICGAFPVGHERKEFSLFFT